MCHTRPPGSTRTRCHIIPVSKRVCLWHEGAVISSLFPFLAVAGLSLSGQVQDAAPLGAGPKADAVVVVKSPKGLMAHQIDAAASVIKRTFRPPQSALGLLACGDRGLLFVDAKGVVDPNGARVVSARPLFGGGVPDRMRLLPLCSDRGEIRLPTVDGLLVTGPGGEQTTLQFRHHARSYGNRSQTGLPRAYAAAWTTYVPLLFDANVDSDPARELVVVNETHIRVFDRASNGQLRAIPTLTIALRTAFSRGIAPGASTRVVLADVDADGTAEALVTQFESVFSKQTRAAVLHLDQGGKRTPLFDDDGFSVVLGVANRQVVRARIGTGVMALSSALVSGQIGVDVESIDPQGDLAAVVSATLQVDVPRAKILGTLPQWVGQRKTAPALLFRAQDKTEVRWGDRFEQTLNVGANVSDVFDLGHQLLAVRMGRGQSTLRAVVLPKK